MRDATAPPPPPPLPSPEAEEERAALRARHSSWGEQIGDGRGVVVKRRTEHAGTARPLRECSRGARQAPLIRSRADRRCGRSSRRSCARQPRGNVRHCLARRACVLSSSNWRIFFASSAAAPALRLSSWLDTASVTLWLSLRSASIWDCRDGPSGWVTSGGRARGAIQRPCPDHEAIEYKNRRFRERLTRCALRRCSIF